MLRVLGKHTGMKAELYQTNVKSQFFSSIEPRSSQVALINACIIKWVELRGGFRGGPPLGYQLLQKVYMSSLSPTFIISVHARFSMSDSFVDLLQEVVN